MLVRLNHILSRVWQFKSTNKSETSIQGSFHNTWLACYKGPQFIVFDKNGTIQTCVQTNVCTRQLWYSSWTNFKTQQIIHNQIQSLNEYTKLSMICSDQLTWDTIINIYKIKKMIHSITFFNKLQGC
jgi:hypothetical protein